jgi:hypothetical protein
MKFAPFQLVGLEYRVDTDYIYIVFCCDSILRLRIWQNINKLIQPSKISSPTYNSGLWYSVALSEINWTDFHEIWC